MTRKSEARNKYFMLSCAIATWVGGASFLVPTVAHAEGSVYVTANRAQEEAKYNSQQVQIITKKDIEAKQAKSAEDIVFSETGVSRTVDAMGRVGVSIRGAEPRHTLILVDGQPVMGDLAKYQGAGDELQRLGTENLDHIEIVQGAASAKYGSDAMGGVINVITNKPRNKAGLQFNFEGIREKGNSDILPFNNVFVRADSGKIGKVKVNIFGSKRDIMPIYASESPRQSALGADDTVDHGFLKNSLRYYGTNANVGVASIIDMKDNQTISMKLDRYREDLERYVKNSDSFMVPQMHYKRDLNRNTMNLTYEGRDDVSNWKAEVNYTRTNENDLTLSSDYGKSTYEGKNTLEYTDNIDHRQWNFGVSGDIQANDNHLVSYGVGMSRETGTGSRLKNAPHTYVRDIDPWDYDKSLSVDRNGNPKSNIYDYSFSKGKDGIIERNKEKEWYNTDKSNPNSKVPEFTYEDFLNYKEKLTEGDPANSQAWIFGTTDNTLKKKYPEAYAKYMEFAATLMAENKAAIDENNTTATSWRDRIYSSDVEKLPLYYYDKTVHPKLSAIIKLNGATFKEEENKRINKQTVGTGTINKQYLFVQDTWQLNKNTMLTPIARLDHSSLFGSNVSFNMGLTHNLNGNTHRRFKANVGSSYVEPGMGELFYNWEMFPSHITAFSLNGGQARLGWYWQGNPNLKPEKSLNFDVSIEGENKNTYSKLTVFRNNIKNYITAYNTGHVLDFHTDLNENTERGIYKFLYAPDMVYSFKNIGKAEITGLEWELKQKLSNKWKARFGYTFFHTVNKSNPDMPRQLLDKPAHKIGIGVDYEDEKTGWSGSLWSDYYINMLDSNSVSGGGGYMTSGTAYERDPIIKAIVLDPVTRKAKKIEGKSEISYSGSDRRTSDMYERKTYGIWNMIVQKKINKDSRVYFGINNLFNHRDDDRALSTRQFRMGINLKFGADATTDKSQPNMAKVEVKTQVVDHLNTFIHRDFNVDKKAGVEVVGDFRNRWDSHLGFDRPTSRVTATSYIEDDAADNLRDENNHGITSRVRAGIDARIGKDVDVRVIASASGQRGVDTDHQLKVTKGFNHQRIDEATVTKHTNKWDLTAGRMTEPMGVTGYWFGKEYDGVRGVWTNDTKQVRVGYGDFSHSTGVTDSAYTHAIYNSFKRAPTVDEFMGVKTSSGGGNEELNIENAGDTIGFHKQLEVIKEAEKKAVEAATDVINNAGEEINSKIDEITNELNTFKESNAYKEYNDKKVDLETKINKLNDDIEVGDPEGDPEWGGKPLPEDEYNALLEKRTELVKEQSDLKVKYKSVIDEENRFISKRNDLENSKEDSKEAKRNEIRKPFIDKQFEVLKRMTDLANQGYSGALSEKNKLRIEIPEVKLPVLENGNIDEKVSVDPTGYLSDKDKALFDIPLNTPGLLDNGGITYLTKWFDTNKDKIATIYKSATNKSIVLDDQAISNLKERFIYENIYKAHSGQRGLLTGTSNTYSRMVVSFFDNMRKTLTEADHYSKLPREALGNATGKVIPTEGVIIQRDVIPAVKRAGFIQYRQQVNNKLGVTAWYLRSTGHENHTVHYTSDKGNESRSFGRLANVFGLGLKYQIGYNTAVSFDYGQNRTDFARYMNGGSIYQSTAGKVYDNPAGNPQFELKGHKTGGTPHFWALRFDVGQSDYHRPGSWNAFIDYKYFGHGAFLGGNGTGAVPDRYLDGIRSFTLGGGYVPTKDFLVEAFYTFDAKGIGQRDTLYGGENFKLGNYTRIQGTYKF
ncbi:TonB-dependent receptor domain-containing protein [Veillonella sp. 3627]|uniref:TonB-dependent receptor domain-containing protein n=1 Tax=Veillonella sp. 3627 TaxID=2490953 RepID=UPI000F8F2121|nr:TonB-dependent receptor [Veillonella sp. 3627]